MEDAIAILKELKIRMHNEDLSKHINMEYHLTTRKVEYNKK